MNTLTRHVVTLLAILAALPACDRKTGQPVASPSFPGTPTSSNHEPRMTPDSVPSEPLQDRIAKDRERAEALLAELKPGSTRRELYARFPPKSTPSMLRRSGSQVTEMHVLADFKTFMWVTYELADPRPEPGIADPAPGEISKRLAERRKHPSANIPRGVNSKEDPEDRLVKVPHPLFADLPAERPKREPPAVSPQAKQKFIDHWRSVLKAHEAREVSTDDGTFVFRFAREVDTARLLRDWHPQSGLHELYLIGYFGNGDMVCAHANGALFAIIHDDFDSVDSSMSFDDLLKRVERREKDLEDKFFAP